MEGFDIRFSELDDLAYLNTWFSFPNACDDFPFNEQEKEDALKNWIGFSKFKASLTGTLNDVPCAVGTLFLMPYKKVAHQCSFYLIVDPDHRRKGFGTSMVRNLIHLAKTRFKLEGINAELFLPCHLEIILDRLDFKTFAKQDDFVKLDQTHYRPRLLMEYFFV
jgi:RimJ/RimL family protein N-acetyltransferase